MLTRKQRWRKVLSRKSQKNTINNCFDSCFDSCCNDDDDDDDYFNNYTYNYDIEKNMFNIFEVKNMIKKNVEYDLDRPNLKKVRFSNVVHATLIPTKEEINRVTQLYYIKCCPSMENINDKKDNKK